MKPAPIIRYILLCCLGIYAGSVTAQSDTTAIKGLEIGVGGGIMLHGVAFRPATAVEDLQGMDYGLRLRYFDHKLVGFQAELSYVQSGWQEDLDDSFTDFYRRETDYVELLLLTQFSVGRGAFQPMLQAGPYLSAPVEERETLPEGFTPPDIFPPSYYGRPFDFRLNYGLQVGLGFNLSIGPVTVQADGRFLIGFNDLVRTGTTTAVTSRRTGYGGRVAALYAL